MIDDDYDFDLEELRQEARAARWLHRQLLDHPDPQDPDYPELEDDEE